MDVEIAESNNTQPQKLSTLALSRPYSIKDMQCGGKLDAETTPCTFDLEDLSDSEDIWIMDIPRLIDPQELCGQAITFGDKSKFKIKDERYCTVAHETNYNVTCVFKTEKKLLEYKIVNIKPTGSLTMRRKLPGALKLQPVSKEKCDVHVLDNLKQRHPLLGIGQEAIEDT